MGGRTTPDLSEQVFGKLTVIARDWTHEGKHAYWLCRCECGGQTSVTSNALRSGFTTSCGCVRRRVTRERSTKHGLIPRSADRRTYNSWAAMMNRCYNPGNPRYPDWGGRGIAVCERWHEYPDFLADMGTRPVGKTIDRINNAGNYEPGNCRWATPKEQQANRRNSRPH